MIIIRDRNSRGHTRMGWLDSWHTFSFGSYHNPSQMGFRALRVINEDRVVPGAGFPTHHHRDMEIVSYVLSGALEHKDDLGNGSIIRPGEVQRMSAGTGIHHSEFNASREEPVHFLQIWILPEQQNLEPGYEQRTVSRGKGRGKLVLIADRHGADGAVTVHQDLRLYAALLEPGQSIHYEPPARRSTWLQLVRGIVDFNGDKLREGDGVAIDSEHSIKVNAITNTEFLLFDLI